MNFLERIKNGEPLESSAITPGFWLYGEKVDDEKYGTKYELDCKIEYVLRNLKNGRELIITLEYDKSRLDIIHLGDTKDHLYELVLPKDELNVRPEGSYDKVNLSHNAELIVGLIEGDNTLINKRAKINTLINSVLTSEIKVTSGIGQSEFLINLDKWDESYLETDKFENKALLGDITIRNDSIDIKKKEI